MERCGVPGATNPLVLSEVEGRSWGVGAALPGGSVERGADALRLRSGRAGRL